MKILFIASLGILSLTQTSLSFADNANGKNLYLQRCSMCHGMDLKATGPLANKSNPSTPDLTTSAFKKRLTDYPGVIVSSIILRPNGDLIPRTLRENGVIYWLWPDVVLVFTVLMQSPSAAPRQAESGQKRTSSPPLFFRQKLPTGRQS